MNNELKNAVAVGRPKKPKIEPNHSNADYAATDRFTRQLLIKTTPLF